MRKANSVTQDHCFASLGKASWCQTVTLGTEFSIRTSHPCKILIMPANPKRFHLWRRYSDDIIGLLHWYRWILSRVGISKDASLRASVDIPTKAIFTDISVLTLLLYSYKYCMPFPVVCDLRKQRHATATCEGIRVSVPISSKCSDIEWYRHACSSAFIAHF